MIPAWIGSFPTSFSPQRVCLVVDGFALPSLSLGARKESAQEQARAAAELLEATRQGAAAARREAQEADDVRRGMAQALNRAIAQCDRDEVGGAGELAAGRRWSAIAATTSSMRFWL